MTRHFWLIIILAAVCGLGILAKPVAIIIDRNLIGEPLFNTWGALRWKEDWSRAVALPDGLRLDWMTRQNESGFRRIAHALGAAGTLDANTIIAMQKAQADGIDLFEVDIWMDKDGQLRCFHGSEDGRDPPPLVAGECTLTAVLDFMVGRPGWIVLDIKTDFSSTGTAITNLLRTRGDASRVIFQLYRPEHLEDFSRWAAILPLQTPIVTVYTSHRGVQHIADQMARVGVRAMALPFAKTERLKRRPPITELLVHPLHDCGVIQAALAWGATGGYVLSGLNCTVNAQ